MQTTCGAHSGNSRSRRPACSQEPRLTGRESRPPDGERSGTRKCRSLTAPGWPAKPGCQRRCQSGRQTRTLSIRRVPAEPEISGPDRENNGGCFAELKERTAHPGISFAARLLYTKAGPPKKLCNTRPDSSNKLVESRRAPRERASPQSPRLASSLASRQTSPDAQDRTVLANKMARDKAQIGSAAPVVPPRWSKR